MLLILHADIAPSPDALKDALSTLKRAVVIVLLPSNWAQFQGVFEKLTPVRKIFVLPAAAKEVLAAGLSVLETEIARSRSIAPLQSATGNIASAAFPNHPCFQQFLGALGDCYQSWGPPKCPGEAPCETPAQQNAREMVLQSCLQGAQMQMSHCFQNTGFEPEPKPDSAALLSPNVVLASPNPVGTAPTSIVLRVQYPIAESAALVLANGFADDPEMRPVYRVVGSVKLNGVVVATLDGSAQTANIPVSLVAGQNTFEFSLNKVDGPEVGFGFINAILDATD